MPLLVVILKCLRCSEDIKFSRMSGSIQQRLFTDEQIFAEIEGILSYV